MPDDEPVDPMDQYAAFSKARQYLRAKATRIYTQLSTNLEKLHSRKLDDYNNQLNSLLIELNDIGVKVNTVLPESVSVESELAEEEKYRDKILACIDILKPLLNTPSTSSGGNQFEGGAFITSSPLFPPQNKLKLPLVELPVFSNSKNDNLEKFLYAFESIVDQHGLSNYEKFVYLKNQVRKGPEALLNSLQPNNQTYGHAKKLLVDAFASPLTQRYDAIKRLTELKLNLGDEVYGYIGEMRSVMASFDNLKIDVETITQYFVWNSLNRRFQDQLIQITNATRPTIAQINEEIFSAAERYLKFTDRKEDSYVKRNQSSTGKHTYNFSEPNTTVTNNLAVNVKSKPVRACALCTADKVKNVEHDLRNCTVYPKPVDKVNKLKSLSYCSKCAFTNHNTANCKFQFHSTCRFCKRPHMSFLCLATNVEVVSSNVSCVYFNNVVRHDSVLLPTFSLLVNNEQKNAKCRVLCDTGSQGNFIREQIAVSLNLNTIKDNVHLQINEFTARKRIFTRIVVVPFTMNGTLYHICAIVVPDIDITLKCDNLSTITKTFVQKGYSLADQQLGDSDVVANFDLVMGPEAISLLRVQTVVFGEDPIPPSFLNSEMGVLVLGDTNSIMRNIKHLPLNTNHLTSCDNASVSVEAINLDVVSPPEEIHINSVSEILTDSGEVNKLKLQKATEEALEACSNAFFSYDVADNSEYDVTNNQIIDYVLSNTDRTPEGRLIMPLPWNPKCKHLLGKNYNLSRKILSSNFHKLKKDGKLVMYDNVFREQEKLGIIQRIENVTEFMETHPDCSFLPHMGVFRMNKETTKVRVVFLSNLCEKSIVNPNAVSHNNALLPGPCINTKLSISLLLSRFDKFILVFDITKAFLGIELPEDDQNKLLCLWYKAVDKGDFSLIAYKNLRLSFGLRPSPAVLMMALYKICILDIENDSQQVIELKKQIYNGIYMDNGMVGSNEKKSLESYYKLLPLIFDEYKFELQQYATNDLNLQSNIDKDFETQTDITLKYFGMNWHREMDTLGPQPICMDESACTKRSILSSLNSVYDLFGVTIPLINRAKLYFQRLQCDYKLDWDAKLNVDLQKEWKTISRQCNSAPALQISRFVGGREGEYMLVAFSDSSAAIYGTVIYIIEKRTSNVSFLLAKNKVVNTKLSKKTIPSLECQGIVLAAETLIDLYKELCTDKTISPINITDLYVYTDSMVCLSWIRSYFINHDKMQKRSVYVMNRLKQLGDLCSTKPITFRFIEGCENPSDCVTRPLSYRSLCKTSYLMGPNFLQNLPEQPDFQVTVPNPVCSSGGDVGMLASVCLPASVNELSSELLTLDKHLVDPGSVSSYRKIAIIYALVLKFIGILKVRRDTRDSAVPPYAKFKTIATNILIRTEQKLYFPDIVQYFQARKVRSLNNSEIPNLVLQLNLYADEFFIIRVRGKFNNNAAPILLSSNSRITQLIITDLHVTFAHAGVYTVLRELRARFWITRGFSTVRKLLRECVTCKKVNENPIKLSQNSYRDFRENPSQIPFNYVFMDYIGPINVRFDGDVRKTWLLIVTCLYTRAVSLQICFSADTPEYLRCLQMHVYRYGLFQLCITDLGTQLKSGANIVSDFLGDPECIEYFETNGINKLTFDQYAKGNSALGSLVEILVKQTKNLILKSIGKIILPYPDYQLLISKVDHIINRRPLAFHESLRESVSHSNFPDPITPEQLLHGRELPSVNIIPSLQPDFGQDFLESTPRTFRDDHRKLRLTLQKLNELYHSEFLSKLMHQAVDKRDRYKPVLHKVVSPGDIVLLVEPQTKRSNYPMAVVKSVDTNSLGEVTSAVVMKGKNREEVFRHSTTLIPLLSRDISDIEVPTVVPPEIPNRRTSRRKAARTARANISSQVRNSLV